MSNRLEEIAGGELDSVQRHSEEAHSGSYIIGVQLPSDNPQERQSVRDLLKQHGGYDIILTGRSSMSTLDA